MNKLTKLLSVFVIAGAVGTGTAFIAGCGHKHSYSGDWTADGENGHYHAATCEHSDEKADMSAHLDENGDLNCDACGFNMVKSVTLNATSKTLKINGEFDLTATVNLVGGTTSTSVTWTSSDPNTVSVTNGKIKGLKAGNATITATSNGVSATCTVKVEADPVTIPVTGIELDQKTMNLVVGGSKYLYATIKPETATNQKRTRVSDHPEVATIDENGLVKAVGVGTATITITTEDGGFSATCKVTVTATEVKAESVSLKRTTLEMLEGTTDRFVATVLPETTTNKDVTYSSDNTEVAEMNGNQIIAKKAGTATITVTTLDGSNKSATCVVTVTAKTVSVESVSLDETAKGVDLKVGGSYRFIAKILPDNATIKNVTYTSSDPTIVKVDEGANSNRITALKEGTVTITVTTLDGSKTATCEVRVEGTATNVPATGVELDKTTANVNVGATLKLTATVLPEGGDGVGATNKSVTWTSADDSIATVDASGTVTGVKAGTVKITVKTEDGGYEASCDVTVEANKVTGIRLDKTEMNLVVGGQEYLYATVLPENVPLNRERTRVSSNPEVATIDDNGLVKAVGVGTAVITITTKEGNFSATCTVTVTANEVKVESVTLRRHELNLVVGQTESFVATVTPDNATNKDVEYTSSDSTVAKMVGNQIEALKAGTTTITVKSKDGSNKSDTCVVTVTEATPAGEKMSQEAFNAILTSAVNSTNHTFTVAGMTFKAVGAKNIYAYSGEYGEQIMKFGTKEVGGATVGYADVYTPWQGFMLQMSPDFLAVDVSECKTFTEFLLTVGEQIGHFSPFLNGFLAIEDYDTEVTFDSATGKYSAKFGESDVYVIIENNRVTKVGYKTTKNDTIEMLISNYDTTEVEYTEASFANAYTNVVVNEAAADYPNPNSRLNVYSDGAKYGLYAQDNSDANHVVATDKGFAQSITENQNIYISLGLLKGDISGYFEILVTAEKMGSKWDMIQFISGGAKKFCVNVTDNAGTLKYNLGTGNDAGKQSLPETAITMPVAVMQKVAYSLVKDATSGNYKLTLTINGSPFVTGLDLGVSTVDKITLTSSSAGARKLTVDKVIVCGEKLTAADYRATAQKQIDEAYKAMVQGYAAEGVEGEEGYKPAIPATHARNKENIDHVYNNINLDSITDIDEMISAVENFENIKYQYDSDKDIEEAIANVKTQLEQIKTEQGGNYTMEENKTRFEELVAIPTETFAQATSIREVQEHFDNVQTELNNIPTDAEIDFNNAKVNLEELKNRISGINLDEITDETAKAGVQEAINAANTSIAELDSRVEQGGMYSTAEVKTIKDTFETAYENALAAAQGLSAVKETNVNALNTFANAKKEEYPAIAEGIANAVSAGEALINGVTEDEYAANSNVVVEKLNEAKASIYSLMLNVELDALNEETHNAAANEDIANIIASAKEATVYDDNAFDTIINQAKADIGARKQQLLEESIDITVYGENNAVVATLTVKYGDKLKLSDISVSAKKVVSANVEGESLTEEGLTVYDATNVAVVLADIENFIASTEWRPTVGAAASAEFEKNSLFTVDNTGAKDSTAVGGRVIGGKTFNSSTGMNAASGGGSSEATPFIITVNHDLASLKVYLTLGDSAGTGNNRHGVIYCVTNDGEPIDIKSATADGDMSVAYSLTGVKKGTTLRLYAVNNNSKSGATFHLFGIDAAIDESKVAKDVSIRWGDSGEVQQYHYYDVVNLPENDPTDGDKLFLGWYYTADNGTETKYEGGQKFPSGTDITFNPKFLEANITATFKVEGNEDVVETFAVPSGEKGITPTVADPAKAGNYFLGWTIEGGDGTVVNFAEIEPNGDNTMKNITFVPVFKVYETWTGTASIPNKEEVSLITSSGNKVATVTVGSMTFYKGSGSNPNFKSDCLSMKAGSYAEITTTVANSKLTISYTSATGGRYVKITDSAGNPVGEGTNSSAHPQAAGEYEAAANNKLVEITLPTAGTYTITFLVGEHKMGNFTLESEVEQEITESVMSISASGVDADLVVKAQLGNGVEVTLTADQYTVLNDEKLIVFGSGKSAADAHKFNSCALPE